MVRRVVTSVLLLALLLPAIYLGGIPYFLLVAAFIGIAAWEYAQMFRIRGYEPSSILGVLGVLLILAARAFRAEMAAAVLALATLAAMAFHLYRYERGRDQAALDMVITLGALVYLGWIPAFLLDLRALQDGLWWLVLILSTVWIADSLAYFVGVRFGRHRMSPRLSPKKSWEGYLAGVVGGTAFAVLLGRAFGSLGLLNLNLWQGLSLGLMLTTLTTLGDLGESLLKRFAGIKDSGTFLPGHGGAFDRVDSLIWAGVLGYFWIRLFAG